MTQARNWCGTLNELPDGFNGAEWFAALQDKVAYAVGQLEMGENTGHQHLQLYVQLKRSQRLGWLRAQISDKAHWEPRKGTAAQAREYCMKEETRVAGPWEVGLWATQGQTRGLSDAIGLLRGGSTMRAVAEELPEVFVRHWRGLREWERERKAKPPRDLPDGPEVWVFWGPSGTGKSRRARDTWPEAYWKLNSAKWWDNYCGQDTVIFDDFKGSSMCLHDFQRVVDRYPMDVEVKGGTVPLSATRYVFTSNKHPADWYSAEADPEGTVMRRINEFCADRGRLIHFVGAPGAAAEREAAPGPADLAQDAAEAFLDSMYWNHDLE